MIRQASSADASALAALATETFLHTWRALVPDADRRAYCAATFTSPQLEADLTSPLVRYLVVHPEGEGLAGYARVVLGATPPEPLQLTAPVQLDKLYFRPEWQGKGVAAPLMDAVIALVQEAGGQTLWLAHHPSNLRAERFYLRQGFTNTHLCLPFHLCGRVYEDTVLVRPLAPAGSPARAPRGELSGTPRAYTGHQCALST